MELIEESGRVFIHPDGRMDRKNAARYIGCSPKTLADWALKGRGPNAVKVGGKVFYFKNTVDDWIATGSRQNGD